MYMKEENGDVAYIFFIRIEQMPFIFIFVIFHLYFYCSATVKRRVLPGLK